MLLHHHAVGVMVLNVVTATVPLCHMLHLQVVQLLLHIKSLVIQLNAAFLGVSEKKG